MPAEVKALLHCADAWQRSYCGHWQCILINLWTRFLGTFLCMPTYTLLQHAGAPSQKLAVGQGTCQRKRDDVNRSCSLTSKTSNTLTSDKLTLTLTQLSNHAVSRRVFFCASSLNMTTLQLHKFGSRESLMSGRLRHWGLKWPWGWKSAESLVMVWDCFLWHLHNCQPVKCVCAVHVHCPHHCQI